MVPCPAPAMLLDYHGPLVPDLGLAGLSRRALAVLGREYLLNGHLQDRASLPRVLERFGDDALTQVAIDEWMAASPIYSRRMQEAMSFVGDDVTTIFKNLQLDIGAPHQFMDFRYRLESPTYGEFWLQSCGALLDVEPMGEKRVHAMCHTIEDPTFDATAAATHPCAKVRPIHRPPRVPADRVPHCRWKVFIDDEAAPCDPHPNLEVVAKSQLASLAIPNPEADAEPGGWGDYAGPFDPDFQLEDLSHRALVVAAQEFCLQSHLLARAFLLCSGQRWGVEAARRLAAEQWTGIAGLTAERVCAAMRIDGDDADALAKLFQLHPTFHPRSYLDLHVEVLDRGSVRVSLRDCPALAEGDPWSWFADLGSEPPPALDAIARAVNPRARTRPAAELRDDRLAWEVHIDPQAEPAPEPPEMLLAKISGGARIVFQPRRPLRG